MAVKPGTSATVSFAGSGIALGILSINIGGMSRVFVDTTVFGTTNERIGIAGDLIDPGELVLEVLMDAEIGTGNTQPEFLAVATGAVIVTMPGTSGQDTITAAGVMTGLSMAIPLEDRMVATMTIKLHGATAFNAVA